MAAALFTKTQQQILALLYGQTDCSFYLNEIVRLTDVGKGAIVRELKKMTGAGLLLSHRLGNQTHYQANPENPIFEELKAITRKTFGIVEVIQQGLLPFYPCLEFAFIYGSVAKGTNHAASDIDLFIVGADLNYSEILDALEPAEQQLNRPINPAIYTPSELAEREQEQNHFVLQVMAGPKLWLKAASPAKSQE